MEDSCDFLMKVLLPPEKILSTTADPPRTLPRTDLFCGATVDRYIPPQQLHSRELPLTVGSKNKKWSWICTCNLYSDVNKKYVRTWREAVCSDDVSGNAIARWGMGPIAQLVCENNTEGVDCEDCACSKPAFRSQCK